METWNFPHIEKDIIIFQIFMVGFDVILWRVYSVVVKKKTCSVLLSPTTTGPIMNRPQGEVWCQKVTTYKEGPYDRCKWSFNRPL